MSLLDGSLSIYEGDARYMPPEILNDDNYVPLDKVYIFSLGSIIYEIIRDSTLPHFGTYFQNLSKGKLPFLPGHSAVADLARKTGGILIKVFCGTLI